MAQRYVYPLVAPPTPDRLEQDKQDINTQFERAFELVDQLAKDTEALKAAEQERTSRIDEGLTMLETALSDLKAAGKRREEDAERLRDDVRNLKDALPKALDAQRDVTDGRLRDVNTELKGLKTLIGQRMAPPPVQTVPVVQTAPAVPTPNGSSSFSAVSSTYPLTTPAKTGTDSFATASASTLPGFMGGYVAPDLSTASSAPASSGLPMTTSPTTTPPKSALGGVTGKASIPEWQRAMMKTSKTASSTNASTDGTTNGTQQASESD